MDVLERRRDHGVNSPLIIESVRHGAGGGVFCSQLAPCFAFFVDHSVGFLPVRWIELNQNSDESSRDCSRVRFAQENLKDWWKGSKKSRPLRCRVVYRIKRAPPRQWGTKHEFIDNRLDRLYVRLWRRAPSRMRKKDRF